jgi:hypothetical protein
LRDHEEFEYLREALEYLRVNSIENPLTKKELEEKQTHCGCAGSAEMIIENKNDLKEEKGGRVSHLRQWPIQLHLVSPNAPYYRNSDLLLAADCCGFSYPDIHRDFLKGKSLAIACPKLDNNKQVYLDKLITMIDESDLKSITVLVMQVPCCSGLVQLVQQAISITGSSIPVNVTIISHTGVVLQNTNIN